MKPYFQDEAVTIYHGDCREIVPGLGTYDCVVMDPPYGVNLGRRRNNNRIRNSYENQEDSPEKVIELIKSIWPMLRAKRIVVTPGVRLMYEYPRPDHTGAFYYPAGAGCNAWGFSCWQPILYYGKDPYSGTGSKPDSFESTESSEKNGHPCPKPIKQWSRLVGRVTLPRETILDPFAGSGTTGRAAKDLGRKCTLIEREEKYCEIAAKRMSQKVFDFGGEA